MRRRRQTPERRVKEWSRMLTERGIAWRTSVNSRRASPGGTLVKVGT